MICWRRGQVNSGNADVYVNPADVFLCKGFRFFVAWLFLESSRQLIPRRKWHLDIRHCMGLE